jgi:type I restriction enzyme R subunit
VEDDHQIQPALLDREVDQCADASLTVPILEIVQLRATRPTWHHGGERLNESPFTDLSPRGPEAMFNLEQVNELIETLEQIRRRALAA